MSTRKTASPTSVMIVVDEFWAQKKGPKARGYSDFRSAATILIVARTNIAAAVLGSPTSMKAQPVAVNTIPHNASILSIVVLLEVGGFRPR